MSGVSAIYPAKMTTNNPKRLNSGSGAVNIGSRPTLIHVSPMRFLIMDAPRQSNLHLYLKEMKKHLVSDVVRVCEATYDTNELASAGVRCHDLEYADGHAPAEELILQWLRLVERTFYSEQQQQNTTIAVHCVAGLGRAPVMVAIALIEFAHMDPVEAVALIRQHRRGAINEKQLLYLESYKRQYKKSVDGGCACVVL